MNPFPLEPWTYEVDSLLAERQLVISEIMAGHQRVLHDKDGDYPDWIEIHNGSQALLDLTGWFLTDSSEEPAQWQFPRWLIPPGDDLVVFASDKNRALATGELHTNFRLASDGEYLALIRPDGKTVVSEFAPDYPPQFDGLSWGRIPGATNAFTFYEEATPGKPNPTAGPGLPSRVQFSRSGGVFREPFQLRLSATESNAIIRFTLDDTLPTETSPAFDEPLWLNRSGITSRPTCSTSPRF